MLELENIPRLDREISQYLRGKPVFTSQGSLVRVQYRPPSVFNDLAEKRTVALWSDLTNVLPSPPVKGRHAVGEI